MFSGHSILEASLEQFSEALVASLEHQFSKYSKERKTNLWLSNVGKPLRQLWFEIKSGLKPEPLMPATKMKFLFGDILEDLLILLAIEAGHTVTDLQKEVEVDGVRGRIDCCIDGVLVDIKSASSRGFPKFADGSLRKNDPFGYVGQLAGYSIALGGVDGAFLAIDKSLGHLALLRISKDELAEFDVRRRIANARIALEKDGPPEELCYQPIPEGKSGNLKLPIGCSYCPWKNPCHPELRTFLYSSGPVYLTRVVKEPQVFEVKQKGDHS